VVEKGRRRPGMGRLIIGGVILTATIALVAYAPTGPIWLKVLAMLAGLVAGACFLRFPPPWPWANPVVLVLFIGVWFALGGLPGIAWFGGFIAGANFGAAWQKSIKQSRKPARGAAWTVDDRGFDTVMEARNAAGVALSALDGKAHRRLDVEHGSARFQVTGSAGVGLVCHRNAVAADEGSWAVLVRAGQSADDSVDNSMNVPMGTVTGFISVPLVNDLGSVESALDDFFTNPGAVPRLPLWVAGYHAEATRLSTR